ncbi:hypothetical protein Hanom_Chr08g00746451 [Helianthus anomalus]
MKRKRDGDDDDGLYIPSLENVQEVQTPPSSGGRKKSNARKHVKSPATRRLKILLKSKPIQELSQPPSPPPEPQQQPSPHQSPPPQQPLPDPIPSPPKQPSPPHSSLQPRISTPTHEQPIITSPHILQTPPTTQPPIQTTIGSSRFKDFPNIPENIPLEYIGDFSFVNDELVKKLQQKVDDVLVENKKLEDREKKLEKRVKTVETENSSLLKRAHRDEQNEYFKLKNKELEVNNAIKEHEAYMMRKVLENLIGKPIEQKFEEIELEEVRARRKAEIEAEMKNKGKGAQVEDVSEVTESPIQNPCPISSVSGVFDVEDDDVDNDDEDDEEDDKEEDNDEVKKYDADDMFSASSHDDDDGKDDDDQGSTCIKVTETSTEENVNDYLHDDANEEPENAGSEGEHVDDRSVDESEKLILRLEPDVEEGEFRHSYTLAEIIKLTHIDENQFKFDFDINQQHEYEYKYVEDANNYDRVEVEDCSDEEQSVNVDTSNFSMLAEFFSQANEDELRRKVEECVKNKSFSEMTKDEKWEELGDFLPQVNAYAIRREFGIQYFAYIQDIMTLPWWDVEELPKVKTLTYPIREHDMPTWGWMKFEVFKDFKHSKPHQPKKVKRVDPVTCIEEMILQIKKPRVLKNIPLPKIEHDFYKGFLCWVYSCMSTEVVITYKVENEVRYIHLYDSMWIVNCSAKDIECLFINKICYKAEDKDQGLQFQKGATICFQKQINSEKAWSSKWRKIEKEEALKAEKERKAREELRGKWMKMQAEEQLKATQENEKLKSLLKRKPKQREEKFNSL